MSTLYSQSDIDAWVGITKYLKHELALARAGESYWRAKYIAKVGFAAWDDVVKEARNTNALYWFERAARSPMDECDE